jgi:molybdopterin-guanine dinucleotide biosynthesis protein A
MMRIAGLILAGGSSNRMGGNEKTLLPVAGSPMLARIIAILAPQCEEIVLSANGDPRRFSASGLAVIADKTEGQGPMSGLADALDWFAANRPGVSHILSAPGDTPFLPADLGARLAAALQARGGFCAVAASGGRQHPVAGLWPVETRTALREAARRGLRSFHAALEDQDVTTVEWDNDPFFNVNTPEDLTRANSMAETSSRDQQA